MVLRLIMIRIKSNLKWYKARWFLLLIFVGGYITTFPIFKPVALEYLSLTMISIFACSLLLACLKPPLVNKLPIWIILGVFIVAYYLKFYVMVWEPEIIPSGFFRRFYWMINSTEILLDTYSTMTYAFVTFCLTAWWLLVFTKTPQIQPFKREINYRRIIPILIWLLLPLMIVTAGIMYSTGIGRMGAEAVYLPFRLAGWIQHIRVSLIPALLLLLIWYSDRAGWQKHLNFGILLLFLHALSDMLLRSSKGSLLVMFMMLILLFVIVGKITKQRIHLFGIILSITIVLWPIISAYRGFRSGSYPVPIGSSLSKSIGGILSFGSISFLEILSNASKSFFFRFVGGDSLLAIVGSGLQPMGTSAFNISITKFVTVEIFGFPSDKPMGVGPSLLGWFYIVGGNYLVVVGIFCLMLLTWMIWYSFSKARLRCLPVAQTLFLSLIISIFSGGALDGKYLTVLVMIGSIAVCEWIARTFGSTTVSKNIRISNSRELRDSPSEG